MRLRDLDATFLRILSDGSHDLVDDIAEADGVMFQCPKCVNLQKGGGHYVICWFVNVPDNVEPKPGRWTPQGTGLDDLTFIPGTPPRAVSVLLTLGCKWHGFVRNGDAT